MPKPPRAKALTFDVCKHGTFTFSLVDKSGNVFAEALVPWDEMQRVAARINLDLIRIAAAGGPAPHLPGERPH
jgi:hypothetical protein